MLRVAYGDGEQETWPIPEGTARAALRRRAAPAIALQSPTFAFRGLRAQPIWTPAQAGAPIALFCEELEAAFAGIADEVKRLVSEWCAHPEAAAAWRAQEEGLLDHGRWKKYELWARGQKCAHACESMPLTTALLERHAGRAVMLDAPGCSYVSLMVLGTRVAPHCGPTNHRLRLHLPILLPTDTGQKLGIQVAGTLVPWVQGKVLLFDDSFNHCVSLNSAETPSSSERLINKVRAILVVDLWHPQAEKWFPEQHRRRPCKKQVSHT
ncbi:hypothetical protein AB1Y20_018670 [Prymnesium parvum]|uniref:Aspartyl/asparaginy/proline hydroxylase domain-containing protein n=1 Tax=Prymnesium parvum TaxID=97485 RepID=A0AB34JSG9_PRYPA